MAEERVLFVFHCTSNPGLCDDWDQGSGGNAAFVLDPGDLLGRATPVPAGAPPSYPEARVVAWLERDDGLDETLRDSFFSESAYLQLGDQDVTRVTMSTRLGGVPDWIQSPDEGPGEGWRFVGQLDSTYSFLRPMPKRKRLRDVNAASDDEHYEGRLWYAEGPNFGDGGVGYIFLRPAAGMPEVRFFWQCG